jgi:preprotein translocase subunit YajC
MQSSLAVGDEVMLSSGIFGVLVSLNDERVRVEIAPGVVVEVARGAVGQKVTPSTASETSEGTDSDREIDREPGSTDTTTEER